MRILEFRGKEKDKWVYFNLFSGINDDIDIKTISTILSKIIDNESKQNPDILDKRVVLSILPCTTNANEVLMCGTYGIGQVMLEKDCIRIKNY